MKHIALLALVALEALAAPRSVVLRGGKYGAVAMPEIPAAQSFRIEMRVHSRAPIHGANHGYIFTAPGTTISNLASTTKDIGCTISGGVFYLRPTSLPDDFTIRLQKDAATQTTSCEIWNTETRVRVAYASATGRNLAPTAGGNWQMGSAYNDSSIGFVRVYSTTVPLDSPPPMVVGGDMLRLEFNDNGRDSSGNGRDVNWSAGGAPQFTDSPVYPAFCSAGQTKVFRAGEPITLDGSASATSDEELPRQYLWQPESVPEASRLRWSSHTAAEATVTGTTFGTHAFKLQITDASGQTATCSVKHGVVAYDDDGVVILRDTTPAERLRNKILGKMIAYGRNPWAWEHDRHQKLADFFGQQVKTGNRPGGLPGELSDWWNTPDDGTVTLTTGSKTVIGNGTNFLGDACNEDGTPKYNGSAGGNALVIWYPDPAVPGRIGRTIKNYVSCQSDTELTLESAYNHNLGGLTYTLARNRVGFWINGSTNFNYYDNVLAYYAMYYRSGIDTYLEYARALADRWWQSPFFDEGRNLGNYAQPRMTSLTGIALRALERDDPDMWRGLRLVWDAYRNTMTKPLGTIFPGDIREDGYRFLFVAHCALIDPDTAHAQQCKNSIEAAFANLWMPNRVNDPSHVLYRVWGGAGYYSLGQVYSWDAASSNGGGVVTVTQGSDIVVGTGTNWTPQLFGNAARSFWVASARVSGFGQVAAGDREVYKVAEVIDATHLRLDRPYHYPGLENGQSRTLSTWAHGQYMGFGTQPFMLGIDAQAFLMGYQATGNTAMRDAATDIADWLVDYGIDYNTTGVYYARGFPACHEPEPVGLTPHLIAGTPGCSYNTDDYGKFAARFQIGELTNALSAAYEATESERYKIAMDLLYNAAFAKPGWPRPPGFGPSDKHLGALDDNADTFLYSSNKNFGWWFGMGQAYRWPVSRLGNRPTPEEFPISVDFELPQTATKARLTLTAPWGAKTSVVCRESPCTVTTRRDAGNYLMQIDYLSANDEVIAEGETSPLFVR